jgi:hypothetical protein
MGETSEKEAKLAAFATEIATDTLSLTNPQAARAMTKAMRESRLPAGDYRLVSELSWAERKRLQTAKRLRGLPFLTILIARERGDFDVV